MLQDPILKDYDYILRANIRESLGLKTDLNQI